MQPRPLFAFSSLLATAGLLFAQAPGRDPAVVPILDEAVAQAIRAEGIEHTQVMRILRDFTGKIGHRLTGSDNFTKACAWAATEFHSMGLPVVKLEKWGEWKLAWNRGVWKGRITSPTAMDLYVATEAWTAGTNGPREGVIAMAPKSMDDLAPPTAEETAATAEPAPAEGGRRGRRDTGPMTPAKKYGSKWLLCEKRPSSELREASEKLGILGWVYRAGDADENFPTRVRVFGDHRRAMQSIEDTPKVPQIAVRADQFDAIQKLLEQPQAVHANFEIDNAFRTGPIPLYNVIAEIPGSEKPDEYVIVSSHFDSWHQAQGCTDNGTGSATTMEAARILMAVGAKPKRTIRFCLWGGEEQGLLGSAAYVKMHRDEMERVSAVFNHDSGTNWAASLGIAESMADQMHPVVAPIFGLQPPDASHEGPVFTLNTSPKIRGGGGSDHASFLVAGVPGLNWGLSGRANYFAYSWHTQWDTYEVAIPEYQRHTATVIALTALGTANLPELLDRTGVDRSGGGGGQAGTYAQALFDADMDGFKFTKLAAGGRGEKMGIRAGDVLAKANGKKLEAMHEIFAEARDLGDQAKTMELELQRGTESVKVQLDLEDLRARRARRDQGSGSPSSGRGGN